MTICEQKKTIRQNVKKILKSLEVNPQNHLDESNRISKKLCASKEFNECDYVFAYVAKFPEADCTFAIKKALSLEKKVCIPRVTENCKMEFFLLKNTVPLENQLENGMFGIKEPLTSLQKINLQNKSLCGKKIFIIVPALAFSKDGKRLGRGKGFYDRYIARLKKCGASVFSAGFCYAAQIFDDIPCDFFDEKVDSVFF